MHMTYLRSVPRLKAAPNECGGEADGVAVGRRRRCSVDGRKQKYAHIKPDMKQYAVIGQVDFTGSMSAMRYGRENMPALRSTAVVLERFVIVG